MKNLFCFFSLRYFLLFSYEILRFAQNDILLIGKPPLNHASIAWFSAKYRFALFRYIIKKPSSPTAFSFYSFLVILVNGTLQHTNVRQVSVLFRIVKAVANYKLVLNYKALILRLHRYLTTSGLVEKGNDIHAGR